MGPPGFHVIAVTEAPGGGLRVVVEPPAEAVGCGRCGVLSVSHGRRGVRLVDAPCFGRPVVLVWRQRTWRCPDADCPAGGFTEQQPELAAPRARLTTRAC